MALASTTKGVSIMTDNRSQTERNRDEKKETDADYPAGRYDDVVRKGADVPRREGEESHTDDAPKTPQSHMGASSGQMTPTKPATEQLANLTDRKGQADDAE